MGHPTVRAALFLSITAMSGANVGCNGSSSSTTTAAAPFDHDSHFLVNGSHANLACIDCHDASAATFAQAAVDCMRCHAGGVVSPLHQGVAGFASVNASCIECHKAGTMTVAHETFFPIAAGTTHTGIACADCHGSSRAVADLRCTSCHGGETAMAGVHGSMAGYAWSGPSCYGCHADGGIPALAHQFPIASGTTHGPPMACADCHGATRLAADLTCTSCHDHDQAAIDPRHAGVAQYRWSSSACFDCHTDGRVPAFAHAFPTAAGTVHGPPILCADCHGASSAPADLRCTSCHDHDQAAIDPRHAGVAQYRWSSSACFDCHTDGRVPAFAHAFPTAAGTVHGPPILCADCHGASSAVADLTCTSCHTGDHAQAATDARHAAVAGYTYRSPACFDCHPTGASDLPANHDAELFPVTGTASHGDLACSQCHGATRALADLTCVPCHGQAATAAQHAPTPSTAIPATTTGRLDRLTYVNYQWSSAYCISCHADGQVDFIAQHPHVDNGLTGGDHHPFCLTCHTQTRASGKTWAADFGQSTCLACHTSNNPD